MPISPARSIAFDVLRRVATQDAYADETLRAALDEKVGTADAALATELTLGVLRWQRLLDFLIDGNLTNNSKKLDIEVRIALRMGVYQLNFLERISAHAAVHESVELVKKARKSSAAPLVNAVLRKAAKQIMRAEKRDVSMASMIPAGLPVAESLGIHYSHPSWIVERWLRAFGEERTRKLLQSNNRAPTLSFYILDPKQRGQAIASLERAGCIVKPGILLNDACALQSGNPGASEAVQKGWIAIQDEASQAVAHLLCVAPGARVLDLCAAPGGKAILLALAAGEQGHVVAGDLRAHRVRAMSERFALAQASNVECITLDGTRPLSFDRPFDRILVDAPCSGTGTLARHPEIRWRLRPEDLVELHELQVSLLRNALEVLAQGGRLVYSTCSLEQEENEAVVAEALGGAAEGKFRIVTDRVKKIVRVGEAGHSLISDDGFFRTFPPSHGTDGFFAAIIEHAGNR